MKAWVKNRNGPTKMLNVYATSKNDAEKAGLGGSLRRSIDSKF